MPASSTTALATTVPTLMLGERTYDITTRTLVMGILNRTPDSFYDAGETYALDHLVDRAATLVEEGADILDVGGVKAGPGPEVDEPEELDRVIPAITALRRRFDLPLSVDTWRASVLAEACVAGAVIGNDISGFGDPDYLHVAATHGASVVATHIRLQPRVADPDPHYDDLVGDVADFLVARSRSALDAGIAPAQIMLDAGLDLGKTPAQSAALLREHSRFAALGHPLFLSASNKRFLGEVLDLDLKDRREASLAGVAYGIERGCRIVRVHDVRGSVRVARMTQALLEARIEAGGAMGTRERHGSSA